MGRNANRRRAAEYAARASFGRVVRVHEEQSDSTIFGVLVGITCIAFVVAGLAVFGLALSGLPAWRLVVLGWVALLLLTLAVWRWGPVEHPDGRRWFGVTEGGLLVWSPELETEPQAIPWSALRATRRIVGPSGAVIRLVWQDDGVEHTFDLPNVFGRKVLLRTVEHRGPVPPRSPLRVAGNAVVGLATALVLWFVAVPVALDIVFGEKPDNVTDLFRMCEGGEAFGRAAPYRGSGPHPLAVYNDGTGYPDYLPGLEWVDSPWPPPDEVQKVQLVGCGQLVGRASPTPLGNCNYEGGYNTTTYQGRYRIDVYEARTGRRITSVTVDGRAESSGGCMPRIVVPSDRPQQTVVETLPDDAAYEAQLYALVNGEVGDN